MDVKAEAKRIMAVSISKLYTSRTQRGGLRLHRSLLLSMVIKSARDIYHAALMSNTAEKVVPCSPEPETEGRMGTSTDLTTLPDSSVTLSPEAGAVKVAVESRGRAETTGENKENMGCLKPVRDSRKRPGKTVAEPDFLPLKKARLETEEETLRTPRCWRPVDALASLPANRAVAAY
ncbi:hypothetical protein P4O66_004434 [Electrophorus voltai]|uniref:Immediate early response 2b n=1 Tax=Electrophorus voltai TaxID=2609070 RepID=A0AAD8ZMK3_9TELE|nr:immediate early response 2b [Electrophorus electricus]KAK1802092.1 hypothetical protein P4O66_004434 [Electrophorus voltai]